jgi:predicted peptidase
MGTALLWLLDDVCAKFRVDERRIYVSGLNEGAVGAWRLALQSPDRFAALLSVMGQGNFSVPAEAGQTLAKLPVWSFMPAGDGAEMQAMNAMFKGLGANWKLTSVPESEAGPAGRPFGSRKIYDWLLRQKR